MILAIDAMGGDNAPAAVLEGCKAVLPELAPDTELLLFGNEEQILPLFEQYGFTAAERERVRTVPTTEVIGCDESPTVSIRAKKDSSLVRAIRAVAEGEADCVLSAGNSGALLTGGTLIIKRQNNVKRPALAASLPTLEDRDVLLVDSGANTDCKPEWLVQFALMGAAYQKGVCGIENPRVGLLNNGAEEQKGSELTKAAYALLKEAPINFIGNVEARDALSGCADVLVADGFDGNVLLKSTEGAASALIDMLKGGIMAGGLRTKLGYLLCKPAFKVLKKKMDYTEKGGAPLLGVNGGVIKAHGSSNARAFRSAILQAERLVSSDVVRKTAEALALQTVKD